MTETQATVECPFCASTLKAHATVCASCGAQRGLAINAKGRPMGKGGILFLRIVVALWLAVVLGMFAGGEVVGGVIGLSLWLLIFFFNRQNIFHDGQYRWYRRD